MTRDITTFDRSTTLDEDQDRTNDWDTLRSTEEASGPSKGAREQIRSVKQWYLIVQEDCANFERGSRIVSQFTPTQVQRNLGSNIAEGGGFSRESPIIQWVGGQVETYKFETRFFSEHKDDGTAEKKLHYLELLRERDPNLGRPPLLAFFWGSAIPDGFPCVIDNLGTITYDEIREDGSLRGITCEIVLKRFKEYLIEQVPTSQTERTPVYIAKQGETYELIALRRYGDPLLGVLLRQMNGRSPMTKNAPSGVADLQPGEEVKLYPLNELQREHIRPMAHVMKTDNLLALDNRRHFFEIRSTLRAVLPRR